MISNLPGGLRDQATLDWSRAVSEGVCSDDEADLLRECVRCDEHGAWHVDAIGLSDHLFGKLTAVIIWVTCKGRA